MERLEGSDMESLERWWWAGGSGGGLVLSWQGGKGVRVVRW